MPDILPILIITAVTLSLLYALSVFVYMNFLRPIPPLPPPPTSGVALTRYPIVFVHGVKSVFYYRNYWNRVPDYLRDVGYDVFVASLPWRSGNKTRSAHLKRFVEEVLEETGSQKVNIIAHCFGGLNSIKLVEDPKTRKKIATITALSTPFRGTPLAVNASSPYLGAFYDIYRRYTDNPPGPSPYSFKPDPENPHPPLFSYSNSAKRANITGILLPQFLFLERLLAKKGSNKANDGLVPAESMISGCYKGDLNADHIQMLGAQQKKGGFSPYSFHLRHVLFLAENGF